MAGKTEEKPTTELPPSTLAEDPQYHAWKDPRYVAAAAKFEELKTTRDEIERRIQAECNRLEGHSRSSRQMAEAAALVHGGEAPAEAPSEDLKRLRHDFTVHQQAVVMAEKKRDELEQSISLEICERVRPAVLKLAVGVHAKLKEF